MGANGVLYRVLSDDLTIILLANTNAADPGEFADRNVRAALREKDPGAGAR